MLKIASGVLLALKIGRLTPLTWADVMWWVVGFGCILVAFELASIPLRAYFFQNYMDEANPKDGHETLAAIAAWIITHGIR